MADISTSKQNDIEGWVGLIGAFGFLAGFGVFAYQVYLTPCCRTTEKSYSLAIKKICMS